MSNNKLDTKAVAEVGLILAAIVVIGLLIVPISMIVGMIILPVPITILYLKYNNKVAILTVAASIILLSMFLGPIIAITSALEYGLTGITLGYCIKNDKSISKTLIYVMIAALAAIVCNMVLYFTFIEPISFIDFINNGVVIIKEQLAVMKKLYMEAGIGENQIIVFDILQKELTAKSILLIIPSTLIVYLLILASLIYTFARSILIRLRYKTIKPLSFSKFYITNLLGALIIALICIGIIINAKGITLGEDLQYSLLMIANIIFGINGMAAVTYYFRKKRNMSKKVVVLILFLSLFLRAQIIYFYIGFVEMLFDFRKLDPYRITFGKKSGV